MQVHAPDETPTRPLATPWDEYREQLLPAWSKLLAANPAERQVQDFLEDNPCLLPGGFGEYGSGGHHGPTLGGVYREAPLQGIGKRRRPDFMWVTRATALITPVCIEIEKPGKRWFKESGRPTSHFTDALDQLTDWKVWFAEPANQAIFRRQYLADRWANRALAPQFILIYGRADEFGANSTHRNPSALRLKRDFMRRSDESFMSFDSLVPKSNYADMITLSMTSDGPNVWRVPPTFTTGPFTMDVAKFVDLPMEALTRETRITDARKQYLAGRWEHWRTQANAPDGKGPYQPSRGE